MRTHGPEISGNQLVHLNSSQSKLPEVEAIVGSELVQQNSDTADHKKSRPLKLGCAFGFLTKFRFRKKKVG